MLVIRCRCGLMCPFVYPWLTFRYRLMPYSDGIHAIRPFFLTLSFFVPPSLSLWHRTTRWPPNLLSLPLSPFIRIWLISAYPSTARTESSSKCPIPMAGPVTFPPCQRLGDNCSAWSPSEWIFSPFFLFSCCCCNLSAPSRCALFLMMNSRFSCFLFFSFLFFDSCLSLSRAPRSRHPRHPSSLLHPSKDPPRSRFIPSPFVSPLHLDPRRVDDDGGEAVQFDQVFGLVERFVTGDISDVDVDVDEDDEEYATTGRRRRSPTTTTKKKKSDDKTKLRISQHKRKKEKEEKKILLWPSTWKHSPLASNYFFKTTFLCPYFVHFVFQKKTSLHMRPHAHVCLSSSFWPVSFFPYVSSYLITYTVIVDDAVSLLSVPLTCSLPLTVYSCTSYSFCYSGFAVSTWCAPTSTFPPWFHFSFSWPL